MRLLVTVALLAVFGPAARAAPADPYAFIVQQVCTDAADHPVPGDPVVCASKRRLRVGEAVPYRRVDAGNFQAFTGYPVDSVDGRPLAVLAKVFGGADTSGSFGDLGSRSGYDLIAVGDTYVSVIRTSDQGAGDQIFWRTAACDRADGWILFPPDLPPGGHGEVRSTLKITKGPSVACPRAQLRNIAPDDTVWDRPLEPVRYTSGKLLPSIVSMHFAYGDPADPAHDNDSMEKFYFTEAYGYSRWEAWQTPQGCRTRAIRSGQDAAQVCQPFPEERCSGDNRAVYFGKLYLRLDCRDDTFYVADPDRPFDPLVSDAAPGDVLSRNLLANPTFFDGGAGWTATPPAQPRREPRSNNAVLALPPGGTLGQPFAIPIAAAARPGGGAYRWGATLRPDAGPGAARLRLTLVAADGTDRTVEQRVRLQGSAARAIAFDLPAGHPQADAVSGRVELVAEGAGGLVVDDMFVTPVMPGR